jgi:Predicted branched-chain amino acid permease (azaleucine resistance)
MKKIIKSAFIATIPVFMGYIVLGMAFGMLVVSQGYPIYYTLLMSLFIYAGSMQFITINLLTSGASLISAALMTLLINARHLVYGLSMLDRFKDTGKYKPYLIFSLTDETYSLLVGQDTNDKRYLFFVSLFDQCYWVIGSLIGSTIGSLITINTTGLDFAMTALFVVIVVDQFLNTDKYIYSYIGFIMSIICLIVFGSTSFIVPSMIGILGLLFIMYKKEKSHES